MRIIPQFLMRRISLALTSLLVLQPLMASAALFPDVPEGSLYQEAVDMLASKNIVKGNPDGKFHPERSVNRAEMLKMLYAAAGRTPNASLSNCFSDVQKGSWYEPYVCDAASQANKFVQGYANGTFKPDAPVSRVEALKMIYTVMTLPLGEFTQTDRDRIVFTDTPSSAWYAQYLIAAYRDDILPLPGQSGLQFYPDKALLRGEAAAMISYAFHVHHEQESSSSFSSSSLSSSSSVQTSSAVQAREIHVTFPFSDSGKFEKKGSVSYLFSLSAAKTTLAVEVRSTGFVQANITCRLYLIDKDGFSGEYYLGIQDNGVCRILITARPGNYQLQIQPDKDDAYFSVSVKSATGDGNDGFIEAQSLPGSIARTGVLGPNDIYDWYTVTIDSQRKATIEVTSSPDVGCIIYTPLNIDQFGFEGPKCNASYDFNPGTYYVGIIHPSPIGKSMTYTMKLR